MHQLSSYNARHDNMLVQSGGRGTRKLVDDTDFLSWLRHQYSGREQPLKFLLSVCTGSALLAKAGTYAACPCSNLLPVCATASNSPQCPRQSRQVKHVHSMHIKYQLVYIQNTL